MVVVLPSRLNAGPGKRGCLERLQVFIGLEEIKLSRIPDTEANCARDCSLIAYESDGVASLSRRGVAFGVCAKQIAKLSRCTLIADALMDGGVAWVAGFDSALLVERDGAEAVEADERGVEGLVWGVGRVLFFGALGSWLGSGHGAAGFGGDKIFAIIFGCLSVDWFVAG